MFEIRMLEHEDNREGSHRALFHLMPVTRPAQLPSAVLIAAAASPPSKVVTPASHGVTASGLALSHAVATVLASPPFRMPSIISPSIARLNFRLPRNLPAFGHSWT